MGESPEKVSPDFAKWLVHQLGRDGIRELAQYGASAGWPGLTYYNETGALYRRYRESIWEAIINAAEDLGESPWSLLGNDHYASVGDADAAEQLIVWVAAEIIAANLMAEWDASSDASEDAEPKEA